MRGDQRHRVLTTQEWQHAIAITAWWVLVTFVIVGLGAAADLGRWFG